MKTNHTNLSILFSLLLMSACYAQIEPSTVYGGAVEIPENTSPCLTESQRNDIKSLLDASVAQLASEGRLQEINPSGTHPLFQWPIGQASGFNYNSIWALSNYIDHDLAFPDQITDYNCGSRSYDTSNGYNHQGFDIISWPFWWVQMDRNQAIAMAGADGQIIYKGDGNFDRNCAFNTNPWNAVYLQHSDGSRSWYLHLKSGSLTSKNVGDTVNAGEFLGVIGSSGSSTLPHLHFEVLDNNGDLIDPSTGPCNDFNNDSWWITQKPYLNPGVNAALTHTNFPVFETCPTSEITNESDQFDLGDDVYFGVYLRDQAAGSSVHLKITRPNNQVMYEWDYDLIDDQPISYWMWIYPNDMEGQWTWEATYMGETATHTFNVGALDVADNELSNTTVYPNPFQDQLYIQSQERITEVLIRDISGRIIMSESNFTEGINLMEVASVATGVYFISVTSETKKTKTTKLVKE